MGFPGPQIIELYLLITLWGSERRLQIIELYLFNYPPLFLEFQIIKLYLLIFIRVFLNFLNPHTHQVHHLSCKQRSQEFQMIQALRFITKLQVCQCL